MRNSIYNIILDNTTNGIVDNSKVMQILHNENKDFQFNRPYNKQLVEKQAQEVFALIESFYREDCTKEELKIGLLDIDFRTIEITPLIFKKFNDKNYDAKVYEVFKEFLFTTNSIQLFNLSLELTAVSKDCIELSEDYILFGQVDYFTSVIAFIFRTWIEIDSFKKDMFKLLNISSDWQSIDYTRCIMVIEGILDSVEDQRNLLIGAISNNTLLIEIAVELAESINLEELIKISAGDRELSLAINNLFTNLLLELERYGGIFAFYDTKMYLNMYFDFLTNTKFEDIQFVGFDIFNEFVLDLKDYYYEYVEGDFSSIIEAVTTASKKYNTPENFDKALTYGEENLYRLINFAKNHPVSESAINYFIELDIKHELDKYLLVFLDSLLAVKGTKKIKTILFKELCDICNQRFIDKPKMSEVNVFNDFESRIILSRKELIKEFWNDGGFELLKILIRDYNPTVRVQTLEFIYSLDKEDLDAELIQRIKNRLIDKPHYIVQKAMKVCEKFELL